MQGGGGAAVLGLRVVLLAIISERIKLWEVPATALDCGA